MRLRMRFFAGAREALGAAGRELELASPPASLAELIELLDADRSRPVLRDPRLRVAVNGRLLGDSEAFLLADGDEVAILPPVTGG